LTPIKRQPVNDGTLSRLKRDLLYHAPRLLGGWLSARNLQRLALATLKIADGNGPATFRMLRQLERASRLSGQYTAAEEYQLRRRNSELINYAKTRNFRKIFARLAQLEKVEQPAPIEVGRLISKEIVTGRGHRVLLKAARTVRKKYPRSVYLIHIVTMCEAMRGDYRKASQSLVRELARPLLADNPKEKRRFMALRDCWRTVDQIARDQMDFADDSSGNSNVVETSDAPPEIQALPESTQQLLRFKEHYLQGRLHSEYLEACDRDFQEAPTLIAKLHVIGEMLRQGVRRVTSYAGAYDLARRRMLELFTEHEGIFGRNVRKAGGHMRVVSELCAMLKLSRKLGLAEESAEIIRRCLSLSKKPGYQPLIWAAPARCGRKGRCSIFDNSFD